MGLLILSPMLLAISILVKISSPGPIIYSQKRVGQYGRTISIYKFRSMVRDADKIGSSVVTNKDSRITALGRFLRRTKLDELPQLWNVLIGNLSLVGPRPDVPEIIDSYSPEMRQILRIKPGLTNRASLILHDEQGLLASAYDPDIAYRRIIVPLKVRLNMEHVQRNSLLFDLSILAKTLYCLFFRSFSSETNEAILKIKHQIKELNQEIQMKSSRRVME